MPLRETFRFALWRHNNWRKWTIGQKGVPDSLYQAATQQYQTATRGTRQKK